MADTFPAILTCTWTCVGAGGGTCTAAGSGNINDTVNLPAGGSVTYTATCTIAASATGTLVNTATVASAVTDPNPANNSATDTDTLTPQADLAITKTDGADDGVAGRAGHLHDRGVERRARATPPGATVADTFPAALTAATWTCVGAGGGTCTAAGSGNINDTVNLPAGGSVTYTLTGTVGRGGHGDPQQHGHGGGAGRRHRPDPGNNSATDTDTVWAWTTSLSLPAAWSTRVAGAPIGGPVLQGQETRTFAVAGLCGIPLTAKSISLNLTVTQPTAAGNVRLFPAGQAVPGASTINYVPGGTPGPTTPSSPQRPGRDRRLRGPAGGHHRPPDHRRLRVLRMKDVRVSGS